VTSSLVSYSSTVTIMHGPIHIRKPLLSVSPTVVGLLLKLILPPTPGHYSNFLQKLQCIIDLWIIEPSLKEIIDEDKIIC